MRTTKINRNIRTLLMCVVFVLFGVLVILHQPSPLRAVVDPVTALATGGAITLKKMTGSLVSGVAVTNTYKETAHFIQIAPLWFKRFYWNLVYFWQF